MLNSNNKKMRKFIISSMLFSLIFTVACKNETKNMKSTDAKYPVAEKQPIKLEKHGDVRVDNYFWMRLSDAQKNAEQDDQQAGPVGHGKNDWIIGHQPAMCLHDHAHLPVKQQRTDQPQKGWKHVKITDIF